MPKAGGTPAPTARITDEQQARNLLRSAILALLKEQPNHGYGLVGRLEELGFQIPDLGGLYRILRVMDEEGLVHSEWEMGERGPAKRVYDLTPAGDRYFRENAQGLVNQRRAIGGVLELYRRLVTTGRPRRPRSSRVLVVEDDGDIRHSLWVLLEEHEWVVHEVSDGEAALELWGEGPLDVAVLDQRLPGLSGLDVGRRLREAGFDGLIVLFSAHFTASLEEEAAILGIRTLGKANIVELLDLLETYRTEIGNA